MAVKYTWNIESIRCAPLLNGRENVVTRVYFLYKGTDGTGKNAVSGHWHGTWDAPEPKDDVSFIDFDKLKESDVLKWVKDNHIESVEHMKDRVKEQIDSLKAPKYVEKALPWVPVESPGSGE